MNHAITEVSRKFALSAHALRFYDKEGLQQYADWCMEGLQTIDERRRCLSVIANKS